MLINLITLKISYFPSNFSELRNKRMMRHGEKLILFSDLSSNKNIIFNYGSFCSEKYFSICKLFLFMLQVENIFNIVCTHCLIITRIDLQQGIRSNCPVSPPVSPQTGPKTLR